MIATGVVMALLLAWVYRLARALMKTIDQPNLFIEEDESLSPVLELMDR